LISAVFGRSFVSSWAQEVNAVLREARDAVEAGKAAGQAAQAAVEAGLLAKLRARYDKAVAFGQAHNRHRPLAQGQPPRLHPRPLAGRPRRQPLASPLTT
jgi:hypothetical protein